MNYNNQYQGGYGQQYPQGGYGGAQYPQHGGQFHSPGGYGGQQYGRPQQSGEHESVLAFFRAVAQGERPCPEELKAVILGVVGEQANGMLAQYGYSQQGSGEWGNDPGRHSRYKEVLEELRDVPNVVDAVKRAGQFFDNLTDEDKKVLQQILNRPSYKKMAQMVNMSPERFMEVKHGLEHKLK
jgi:hypothetical protein